MRHADEPTKPSPAEPDRAAPPPDDPVEEADEESFPASDPPSWSPGHPGRPHKNPVPAPVHPRTDELLQHLQQHRQQLHETVKQVAPADRQRRPAPDRWSVAEVLEHLALIENGVAGMLHGKLTGPDGQNVPPAADTTPVVPSLDPRPLLDRRRRIMAPQRVQPSGTLTASDAWVALSESRERLRAAIIAGDGLALDSLSAPHPVFGPLDFYQWITAVGTHEARHGAQIREIAEMLQQEPGAPSAAPAAAT